MKLQKKFISLTCALIFCTHNAIAMPTHHQSQHNNLTRWHPVLAITGGMAILSQVGKSQAFPTIDGNNYYYSANQATQSQSLFGTFIGEEWRFNPEWALQFGLAYYQTSAFTAKGTLTQGPDESSSDQYHYNYNIFSRQALFESKLLAQWHQCYHPYISAGLGESFNKTSNYQADFPVFLTFSPLFDNHTNKSFTYNVGAGLDVDLTTHMRAGIGYRFTDLGKANLGAGVIDTTPIANTLKQSHMYTQELLAQLTFII